MAFVMNLNAGFSSHFIYTHTSPFFWAILLMPYVMNKYEIISFAEYSVIAKSSAKVMLHITILVWA